MQPGTASRPDRSAFRRAARRRAATVAAYARSTTQADAPLRDVRISPNEELHTKASALTLWRGHSRYSLSHPSSVQRERDFQRDFNRWWNKCSSLTDAECAAIRDGTLVAVAGFRLMPLSSFLKVHIKTNAVVSPISVCYDLTVPGSPLAPLDCSNISTQWDSSQHFRCLRDEERTSEVF